VACSESRTAAPRSVGSWAGPSPAWKVALKVGGTGLDLCGDMVVKIAREDVRLSEGAHEELVMKAGACCAWEFELLGGDHSFLCPLPRRVTVILNEALVLATNLFIFDSLSRKCTHPIIWNRPAGRSRSSTASFYGVVQLPVEVARTFTCTPRLSSSLKHLFSPTLCSSLHATGTYLARSHLHLRPRHFLTARCRTIDPASSRTAYDTSTGPTFGNQKEQLL
jgi:hypothetical protein